MRNQGDPSISPETCARGPLFFSGGTALGPVASALARRAPHAVHVITTFDSGGSSAVLRDAFSMPAVGDVRARLAALADPCAEGGAALLRLFTTRLPGTPRPSGGLPQEMGSGLPVATPASPQAAPRDLVRELEALAAGEHPLARDLAPAAARWARARLTTFLEYMPPGLDLAGASLGNLILTAAYLTSGRSLRAAAEDAARSLGARGAVLPVAEASAHLCVRLGNGERIVGQHRFTGKISGRAAPPIQSPIRKLWLAASLDDPAPIRAPIAPGLAEIIRTADLICYPVGSFFSSVLANLLPQGVSEAVRAADCPKVFLPNLGSDPELFGLGVREQVGFLLGRLLPPSGAGAPGQRREGVRRSLSLLLVDADERRYAGGIPHAWLERIGVRVVRAPLVTPASEPYLDADRVCDQIMALLPRREQD